MKILDKLIVNRKLFIFLVSIALFAIVIGSVFACVLAKQDNTEITNETNNFLTNLSNINYYESFKNVFFSNIFFLIIIWIIAISIIGIPISLILFFIKSFSLGFTLASFIITNKLKGLLINIIYIFPSQIINLFITIYLLSISLIISFKLLNSIVKRKSFDFSFIGQYKKVLLFSIILFFISNLYEIFLTPKILKLVLHFIN